MAPARGRANDTGLNTVLGNIAPCFLAAIEAQGTDLRTAACPNCTILRFCSLGCKQAFTAAQLYEQRAEAARRGEREVAQHGEGQRTGPGEEGPDLFNFVLIFVQLFLLALTWLLFLKFQRMLPTLTASNHNESTWPLLTFTIRTIQLCLLLACCSLGFGLYLTLFDEDENNEVQPRRGQQQQQPERAAEQVPRAVPHQPEPPLQQREQPPPERPRRTDAITVQPPVQPTPGGSHGRGRGRGRGRRQISAIRVRATRRDEVAEAAAEEPLRGDLFPATAIVPGESMLTDTTCSVCKHEWAAPPLSESFAVVLSCRHVICVGCLGGLYASSRDVAEDSAGAQYRVNFCCVECRRPVAPDLVEEVGELLVTANDALVTLVRNVLRKDGDVVCRRSAARLLVAYCFDHERVMSQLIETLGASHSRIDGGGELPVESIIRPKGGFGETPGNLLNPK